MNPAERPGRSPSAMHRSPQSNAGPTASRRPRAASRLTCPFFLGPGHLKEQGSRQESAPAPCRSNHQLRRLVVASGGL